jgi:hypothetical protein
MNKRLQNTNAIKFIAGLWLYVMQEGTEGDPTSVLETCADFVQLQSSRHGKVHSTISSITYC